MISGRTARRVLPPSSPLSPSSLPLSPRTSATSPTSSAPPPSGNFQRFYYNTILQYQFKLLAGFYESSWLKSEASHGFGISLRRIAWVLLRKPIWKELCSALTAVVQTVWPFTQKLVLSQIWTEPIVLLQASASSKGKTREALQGQVLRGSLLWPATHTVTKTCQITSKS